MNKAVKNTFIFLYSLFCISIIFTIPSKLMNICALNGFEKHSKEISGNFADDRVLVVLSNQHTKQFRKYTASDFPEIDASSVEELTKLSSEVLK